MVLTWTADAEGQLSLHLFFPGFLLFHVFMIRKESCPVFIVSFTGVWWSVTWHIMTNIRCIRCILTIWGHRNRQSVYSSVDPINNFGILEKKHDLCSKVRQTVRIYSTTQLITLISSVINDTNNAPFTIKSSR